MIRHDLVGEQIGSWKVLKELEPKGYSQRHLCQCVCGKIRARYSSSLVNGDSKSCGCQKYGHGLSKTLIYSKWADIKKRCHTKTSQDYKDYGGRGIYVCDEWRNDAEAFVKWALENGYEEGLQIDRIDNDKGYSPDNCRFVTNQENSLNKRLLSSSNKSGYRGVYYCNTHKYYKAQVGYKNKKVFTKGGFKSKIAAAIARDTFIIENNLPHKLNFTYLEPNTNNKNGWINTDEGQ